ncbi:hypothetical protein NMY22_g1488 [Coprinellus aureogranulatus]|nr:hypothetical protein NMY22_g1488 [Coprinellus aureogranulatus]
MSLQSPELNYVGLAKVTRKVLDRLAPFCHMKEASLDRTNSSSSEPKMSPFGSPLSSPEVSPSPSLSGLPPTEDQPIRPAIVAGPSSKVLSPQARTKLVEKIRSRVIKIVEAIDSHIHSAQVAFKMCREGMVLCDEEVRGKALATDETPLPVGQAPDQDEKDEGLSSSHRHSKEPQSVPSNVTADDGWDVDIDPDEADNRGVPAPAHELHAYGTSGHHFLLHQAHEGLDLAKKTEECFDAVQQEVYKIAAQTKDRSAAVLVPSAPGQEPTIRKQLKDVGLDLVANLTLLESGFARQVKGTVAWWQWVIADLEKGEQSALVPLDESSAGKDQEAMKKAYAWWEEAKEGWQAYYDVIATLHIVYHDLLVPSARAWDGTTVVVKPHQDSDEDLPQGGTHAASKTHTRDASKQGTEGTEEFERQSVPQRVESLTSHQDMAAGCMRITGFLTWGRSYTKSKPSKSAEGGSEEKKDQGKARRRSLKWAHLPYECPTPTNRLNECPCGFPWRPLGLSDLPVPRRSYTNTACPAPNAAST